MFAVDQYNELNENRDKADRNLGPLLTDRKAGTVPDLLSAGKKK
jgi:hypothetical protein